MPDLLVDGCEVVHILLELGIELVVMGLIGLENILRRCDLVVEVVCQVVIIGQSFFARQTTNF